MIAAAPARVERLTASSATLGIGVVGAVAASELLVDGGLAPIVVAAGTALVIGAPGALAEWRSRGEFSALPPAASAGVVAMAEVVGLLLASAVLAWLAAGG